MLVDNRPFGRLEGTRSDGGAASQAKMRLRSAVGTERPIAVNHSRETLTCMFTSSHIMREPSQKLESAGSEAAARSTRCHGAREFTPGRDGASPGRKFGIIDVPHVNHLWPDLQIDRDIRGTGDLSETNRIVEQRLRG